MEQMQKTSVAGIEIDLKSEILSDLKSAATEDGISLEDYTKINIGPNTTLYRAVQKFLNTVNFCEDSKKITPKIVMEFAAWLLERAPGWVVPGLRMCKITLGGVGFELDRDLVLDLEEEAADRGMKLEGYLAKKILSE
jgi:hypothetical protein